MTIGLETVVSALAGECDGAKRRDGRGFSRADANEGARLAALADKGIAWSVSDVKRAVEMASRHPQQAAQILCAGDKTKMKAIEVALRNRTMPPLKGVVKDEKQEAYNFAATSPGGRMAYLWKMSWIADVQGLGRDLTKLATFRHGVRRIHIKRAKAETSMGGGKRRLERMEIDVNGTSLPIVLAICEKYGFAVDPALRKVLDPVIDGLRKHANAAWLVRSDNGNTAVAVLDLNARDEAFSADMKSSLRGFYTCDPDDDWNWRVQLTERTAPVLKKILTKYKFACAPELAA